MYLRDTLSHGMVEIGRGIWTSSGPSPQFKHGHPEQVTQDHVLTAFQCLQGWKLHNLSEQLLSVLSHPSPPEFFQILQSLHLSPLHLSDPLLN